LLNSIELKFYFQFSTSETFGRERTDQIAHAGRNWIVGDGRDIWTRQTAWRRLKNIFSSVNSSLILFWLKFLR